jgi:predicted secreted protein
MAAVLSKIISLIMTALIALFPSVFAPITTDKAYQIEDQKLYVILDSNPSTGCTWELENSNSAVIACDYSYYKATTKLDSSSKGLIGVGGHDVFVFNAVSEGTATLTFTYGQHWTGGTNYTVATFNCAVSADGTISVVSYDISAVG